jgi:hypothetical protein
MKTKQTESFKSLIAAIEANDEKAIELEATRVVRERIACGGIKPRKTRCKTR